MLPLRTLHFPAEYLIYIYIVCRLLLATYILLLTTLKRLIDRITPFHAIRLRFNGLYRGRAPLNPPKASSAAKKRSYIYF